MYILGFILIIIDILPGFFIMLGALRLHKYITVYMVKTGKFSKFYETFSAFITLLITSIIIVFISLYVMRMTNYLSGLILPHGF